MLTRVIKKTGIIGATQHVKREITRPWPRGILLPIPWVI